MTDCFVVLGEPRGPWLDGDRLEEGFLRQAASLHPDRHHGADEAVRAEAEGRYSDMSTAYQTLRDPRRRLLHLLELETGARPREVQRIPPGTMDLFVEVGQACRDVDAFLEERAGVSSPMLKVKLFGQGISWTESLQVLKGKVDKLGGELDAELRRMNDAWAAAPAIGDPERATRLPLERLEEVYRVLSYVARWSEQIQERMVRLASG